MKVRPAALLLAIFLGCLAANAGFLIVAFWKGAMYSDDIQAALLKVAAIYAIHISAIAGGLFAKGGVPRWPWDYRSAFAVALAVLWNLAVLWRVAIYSLTAFGVRVDDIAAVIEYLDKIPQSFAFLITGWISFYFARKE